MAEDRICNGAEGVGVCQIGSPVEVNVPVALASHQGCLWRERA